MQILATLLIHLFGVFYPGATMFFGTNYTVAAGGGQTTLATDNLTGVAGTLLHTYNANWDNATYNAQCGDDQIATGGTGAAANGAGGFCDQRTGATWTNDQFVQATLRNMAPTLHTFVCLRMTATTALVNGYCFGTDPSDSDNRYRIVSWNAGTISTLHASTTVSATSGDVINFQIKGTAFTVKINGSTVAEFSITDTTWTTGNPGIMLGALASGTSYLDTWSAGSVT